jgi:hypothetical protein
MDLARALSLRPTASRQGHRWGPEVALEAPAASPAAQAVSGASGFRDTLDGNEYPGRGAETLREITGEAQRAALQSGEVLPGAQESCLSPKRQHPAGSCDRIRASEA